MKILVAIDSFKGSLSSVEVSNAIETGIKEADASIEVIKAPMADGGEGTVEAIVSSTKGEIIHTKVHDPLGREIDAYYGILGNGKTAVIEMALASGITLLKEEEKNPLITTTYGTGELILDALNRGCRDFIIGIGGSATNDGGSGMAEALGVKFLDDKKKKIDCCGGDLSNLKSIDISNIDKRIKESKFVVACDVDNPLWGVNGASYVYGPQKGASDDMVVKLDSALYNYNEIIKKDLGKNVGEVKGSGAAGGLGAGILAFLDGELKSGINIVMKKINLEEKIVESDLVITGEGKIDDQTKNGKVPYGVAKLSKKYDKKVIVIAGSIEDEGYINHKYGLDAIFSIINYPLSLKEVLNKEISKKLVERNSEEIIRLINLFRK